MSFFTKKENINYFDAIQLISLDNTLKLKNNKPTSREYDFNRIFRGYSRKFYTPLHVVYTLPLHQVLTAYFDDLFENMENEDLEEARIDLLKSEAERAKEAENAEANDNSDFELLEQMAKEAESSAKLVSEMAQKGIKPLINNRAEPSLGNPLLEQPKLMPDIKMKFISESEMSKTLENDSLGLLD